MTRARRIVVVVLALPLVLASLAVAAGPHDDAIARFRDWAAARMEQDATPGLSIGVAYGDFTWADGFGWADLENRVPATADSAYRLASVTKPMTAIGVLKLVAEGKVDLDADVREYVPYYPTKRWPLTVRQVLGHLGGISHYRDYDAEGHFKDHKDTRESVRVFADFELVAEPGTRYAYSSYGYNLLGAVIEEASGRPYGEYMDAVLWAPLGMDAIRMDDPDAIIPNRVRGYRRGPDGSVINSEFVNISSRFAAGGTRATVRDLLQLGRGLGRGEILPPDLMRDMLTPMVTRGGIDTGYGMGWGIRPMNGRFAAAHSGGQAETATYLLWFPDDDLTIAAAMNLEGGDRMPYVRRLYEEITGEAWVPEAYADGAGARIVLRALRTAWNEGLSAAEHAGGAPITTDPERLERAFAFFSERLDPEALAADPESARGTIERAGEPMGGRLLQVAGSYMASRLLDRGDAGLTQRLHAEGPLVFFDEYVRLYRSEKGGGGGEDAVPETCRFDADLEALVAAWRRDWSKAWSAGARRLDLGDPERFEATIAELVERSRGAAVCPDWWGAMEDRVEALVRAGEMQAAVRIAEAGRELYPELAGPHFFAGLLALAAGEGERARALMIVARVYDPATASANALNNRAYRLRAGGDLDLGLALLEVAIEMHPEVANLYDSVGEFHLAKGDRERAIEFYERALEVDPELSTAQRVLTEIRKGR